MEEKLAEAASALAKVPAPPPVSETLGSKDSQTRQDQSKGKAKAELKISYEDAAQILYRPSTDAL